MTQLAQTRARILDVIDRNPKGARIEDVLAEVVIAPEELSAHLDHLWLDRQIIAHDGRLYLPFRFADAA